MINPQTSLKQNFHPEVVLMLLKTNSRTGEPFLSCVLSFLNLADTHWISVEPLPSNFLYINLNSPCITFNLIKNTLLFFFLSLLFKKKEKDAASVQQSYFEEDK